MSGIHLISPAMSLFESLPPFFFPTRSSGLRWLREQLRDLGVTAPLSPGCLMEFVMSAAQAAQLERAADRTYAKSLHKQLETRARFVHLWTTTDDKLESPEWNELITIARRHLLPRAWAIPQTSVTEVYRDDSFAVPQRLIVKGPRGHSSDRPLERADDLPGSAILSDLKRAGDKS
jgi:hypothetical protein